MSVHDAYRAAPVGALRCVPVAPLSAVFDRRSGQTHLLASPLPEILAILDDAGPSGMAADAVADRLAKAFDIVDSLDPATRANVVRERLAELAALGLVDRMASCATP